VIIGYFKLSMPLGNAAFTGQRSPHSAVWKIVYDIYSNNNNNNNNSKFFLKLLVIIPVTPIIT
jgi:hypothetical protein